MSMLRVLILSLALSGLATAGEAASPALGELYRVTTLRAAPGKLVELLALYTDARDAGHWLATGDPEPMLMRHSQGDHWDMLLLQPIGSYGEYFSASRAKKREVAGASAMREAVARLVDFREELFAWGPPESEVRAAYAAAGLFHIEMFSALAGQHERLVAQREMENRYLRAVKLRPNLIWVGDFGSDVDVFTIGFHPSLPEFAAPPAVGDAEADAAAKAAGFAGRAFIGTYLRELIAAHHDTLAAKP